MANDISTAAAARNFRDIISPMTAIKGPLPSGPKDTVSITGESAAKTARTASPGAGAPAAPGALAGVANTAPKSISQMDDAKPLVIEPNAVDDGPQLERLRNFVPDLEKSKLIETPTTVANLGRLGRSLRMNENVLMVGATGVGKTSLVKYLAALTNNELRRINLSDMTDNTELIGGWKPGRDGGFVWQDGIITEALRKGQWLLLDEINLADPAILERLNSVLDDDRFLTLTERNNEVVHAHPNTRIFATMNPSAYSGRKELSEAMLNRFNLMYQDPYPAEELVQILEASANGKIDKQTLMSMVGFHNTVQQMADHRQIGKGRDGGGPYPYTLRDLLKWVARVKKLDPSSKTLTQTIVNEGRDVYMDRLIADADKKSVQDVLKLQLDATPTDDIPKLIEKVDAETIKIGQSVLKINPDGGKYVPEGDAVMVGVPSTMKALGKMARCAMMDEPVLLVGPTAAGKTSMVRYLSYLTNNNFRRFNLEHQTDVSEFIGGYIPKPGGKPGEFVWKDGILVDAMKHGDWVVFDEINLAQPAILERINSLLDSDREITLTEKGNEVVHAHPNFRIFATMNPATAQYAGRKELSLAMRNRFTEAWVPGVVTRNENLDICNVWMKKLPADGEKVAEKMVDFHMKLVEKIENRDIAPTTKEGKIFTIRNLKRLSRFMNEFTAEEGIGNAFYNGIEHVYAARFSEASDREKVMELARTYLPAPLKEVKKD